VKVFVHLAYGYAPAAWKQRIQDGTLVGINDCPAYGYTRAEQFGCSVTYSQDHRFGVLLNAVRLLTRICFGFDFCHAWFNRREIFSSDVIWTHTESQSLAIAALCLLRSPKGGSPRLIAQTVWLFDKWEHLTSFHRYLYRKLLARADVMTFLSPLNLRKAQQLFPNQDCRLVKFGIRSDHITSRDYQASRPIRILSIGNDVHRDWDALIMAFGGHDIFDVRIATRSLKQSAIRQYKNIKVIGIKKNDELMELYRWANLSVILLKENLHASGITVILEAFCMGLPVVASNVGGLSEYFSDREVFYVESHDDQIIRESVLRYASDLNAQKEMVLRAQGKILAGGLNSEGFAHQHFIISKDLLGDRS
jgi:glycosyltransferase involved in cell wall biosynthesis